MKTPQTSCNHLTRSRGSWVSILFLVLSSGMSQAQTGLQDQDSGVGDYYLSKVNSYQNQPSVSVFEAIRLPFLDENRTDFDIYDTFHFDRTGFLRTNQANTDYSDYYAPMRNFVVEGAGYRALTAGLVAQDTGASQDLTCPSYADFNIPFYTQRLLIQDSALELIEVREKCIDAGLDNHRDANISDLVVQRSMQLDGGTLRALDGSRLAFSGTSSFRLNAENKNKLVIRTKVPWNTDIDVTLEQDAELVMGEYPRTAELTADPLRATGSSLTMKSGSRLTLEGAKLHLVGDPNIAPSGSVSTLDNAVVNLKGNSFGRSELILSEVSSNNSTFFFQASNSALRAGILRFTGDGGIVGMPKTDVAYKTYLTDKGVGSLLSVANGNTSLTCPTCGNEVFTIYTRELLVASDATLATGPDVYFDDVGLEIVDIKGVWASSGEQLSLFGFDGAGISQFKLESTGQLRLSDSLELRFRDRGGLNTIEGVVDFTDGQTVLDGNKILTLRARGDLDSKLSNATIRPRLNPDAWTTDLGGGLLLKDYSDAVFVRGKYNKIEGLGSATLKLEAFSTGKSAADYATGGFNDSVHGPGTYNVILVNKQDDGTYPDFSNGDRFGTVTLGTSMPSNLVASITRGLNDPEIVTQAAIGAKARVVQVKLSLAAGNFTLSYSDVATNESQAVQVSPVLSNGGGTLEYFGPDIIPTDNGAAFTGTADVNPVTGVVTLTPLAGDAAACSGGNGGRTFEVQVVATRQLDYQPMQTASTTFAVQVCAGGSVSPYISYPNILASETVSVGDAISKMPTVFGFSPTSYSVVDGTIPAGLTLNTATGEIAGTATEAANGADAAFTIEATDGTTTVSDPVTLTIDPTVSYTAAQAEIGKSYTSAAPTTSPYSGRTGSYALTSTPAGSWSIDATGKISGIPETFGDNVFTVSYEVGPDGSNNTVTATFHLQVIGDPIVLTYAPEPAGYKPGDAVSLTPTISNDRDVVTYAAVLPTGWSIDAATGKVTGIMPTAGAPVFQVTAKDKYTSGSASVTVLEAPAEQLTITGGPSGVSANLSVTGCSRIVAASFITPPSSPSKPVNTDFPFGLLDFELEGCNALSNGVGISIQYSEPIPDGAKLYKEEGGNYFPYPDVISGDTVFYTLTDNAQGDEDSVAGKIHDPAGLGIPRPILAPTPVPVGPLGIYGLLVIALIAMTRGWQRLYNLRDV